MTTDTYRIVKETARKVIIEMGLRKVLLTPENYHTWYEYARGGIEGLVHDINALKEADLPFTETINRELYRRHIAPAQAEKASAPSDTVELEMVRQAQEQTEALLKNLLSEVLETSSSAATYNDNLRAYSSRIGEAKGIAELQGVVRDLLRDTAGMAKSSASLQGKLEQATQETRNLRQRLQDARKDALVDALTGIRNRRWLDAELAMLVEELATQDTKFSVIMLDVDHFKRFNDTHGHQPGDQALKQVGLVLTDTVDGSGTPARYGGEEFSVLVPRTGLEGARYLAERIRVCLSKAAIPTPDGGAPLHITASLGVAEARRGDTVGSVVKRADDALYLAKQSGRNQVKTEADLPTP